MKMLLQGLVLDDSALEGYDPHLEAVYQEPQIDGGWTDQRRLNSTPK
ncbi:MAG: hypothetical protein HQ508_05265 [Candidatus Marinimicrobia bacterium]|nr:hypothetical protein [Candidatus Neomarinimicrobiota bacterium]